MKNFHTPKKDKKTSSFKLYTLISFILYLILLILDPKSFITIALLTFSSYFYLFNFSKISNISECMQEENKSDNLINSENPLSPGTDVDEGLQNINTIYQTHGGFDINKNPHINEKWQQNLEGNLSTNTITGITVGAGVIGTTHNISSGIIAIRVTILEGIYNDYKETTTEEREHSQTIIKTELGEQDKITITENEKLE